MFTTKNQAGLKRRVINEGVGWVYKRKTDQINRSFNPRRDLNGRRSRLGDRRGERDLGSWEDASRQ